MLTVNRFPIWDWVGHNTMAEYWYVLSMGLEGNFKRQETKKVLDLGQHPPKPTGSSEGYVVLCIFAESCRDHNTFVESLNAHRCIYLSCLTSLPDVSERLKRLLLWNGSEITITGAEIFQHNDEYLLSCDFCFSQCGHSAFTRQWVIKQQKTITKSPQTLFFWTFIFKFWANLLYVYANRGRWSHG